MAELIETGDPQDAAMMTGAPEDELVSWVVGRVLQWETERDTKHRTRWEEYYRLWRGIWDSKDKNRKSERSKLINPALQQAIEAVTSEIESAVLDKAKLFDIIDNRLDQDQTDVQDIRNALREDLKKADVETALNEIFLNGSIFGTGIGKLEITDHEQPRIRPGEFAPEVVSDVEMIVKLTPVLPTQFVIDTAAKNLKEALGAAHVYPTPRHEVIARQQTGEYLPGELGPVAPDDAIESDELPDTGADNVNLIHYYGKVPRHMLQAVLPLTLAEDEEVVELFPEDTTAVERSATGALAVEDDEDLVEAIILIANGGKLLLAQENPTITKESLFLAYRHELVPDQFWGRGVAEKGYNSQKALDASLRARVDGLALTVHPMMGIDAGKMPRGFKFSVSPGKTILTNGDPAQVLRPLNFGNIDPNVFTNTSELERMVSMSTGGFDTAAPVTVNNRNETASGMSMMLGSFVKRSKRTIRNVENEFLIPMIKKMVLLYMQFSPERYRAHDLTFQPIAVKGNMARELEQQQFADMLQTVPQDSPAFWMLLRSVYETSDISNRESMIPLIDQQMQAVLNPPPPPPDPLVELRRMEIEGKIRAEAARIRVEFIRAQAEVMRATNDARLAPSEEARNEAAAILDLAKAEAQELGSQLNLYQARITAMEAEAAKRQRGLDDVEAELTTEVGT